MRPTLRGNRWRARPVAATGLRLLTILLPIAAAFGATAAVRPFLPSPHGWVRDVAWWGILLFVATAVAMAVERLGRRLVPLIMLLKLSMLFPDRAPSRFAVARHAGSVHKLRARLAEIQADPQAATESASAAAILALATALQTHDRKTRGHAERVRVYTDLLAEELDLSRDDRYRLRWAALLHDIGKLTVNARILNKPRKLNEREWDVIQHPAEGARIATPLLEWMGPWANAIEQHHERFGGGGYPAGIEGEEISLAGRIVAVADCYDTMTAARTYKKPMAVRAAREELARCSPSQFRPCDGAGVPEHLAAKADVEGRAPLLPSHRALPRRPPAGGPARPGGHPGDGRRRRGGGRGHRPLVGGTAAHSGARAAHARNLVPGSSSKPRPGQRAIGARHCCWFDEEYPARGSSLGQAAQGCSIFQRSGPEEDQEDGSGSVRGQIEGLGQAA